MSARQRQSLRAACERHDVVYRETSGILMIELGGIDAVLTELGGNFRVLGFDTSLDGDVVHPRLDYITDFGQGLGVQEALAAITHWPRDEGLWIEAVLAPGGAG